MQSSNLLKMFELILLSILEEKISLNSFQFGFKKDNSTADAALLLKETIHHNLDFPKSKQYALYIDLSKAFDSVDHFKLGNILLNRGVPPDLLLILMNYLRNQTAFVCWNGNSGNKCHIKKGVRQGGCLSPFLFKLYIDDCISLISELEDGTKFGFVKINVLAYADDIVLISRSIYGLANLYRTFKTKMNELGLTINITKTKCMIFTREKSYVTPETLCINNDVFDTCTQYQYLGFLITSDLCDKSDLQKRLNTFHSQLFSLEKTFCNLDPWAKFYLFNAYCRPNYGLNICNASFISHTSIFKAFEIAYII